MGVQSSLPQKRKNIFTNQEEECPLMSSIFSSPPPKRLMWFVGLGNHCMYVPKGKGLRGFGWNKFGQLGVKTNGDVKDYVEVDFFSEKMMRIVKNVSLGFEFSLFQTTVGSVYATGRNSHGQLSIGDSSIECVFSPEGVALDQVRRIRQICAGFRSSYYLTTLGEVFSSGSNDHGELGQNDKKGRRCATKITSLKEKIAEIVAGRCVVAFISRKDTTGSSKVLVCGRNSSGMLALGNKRDQLVPVEVRADINLQECSIKFGSEATYFLTYDQKVHVVGSNACGEFGKTWDDQQQSFSNKSTLDIKLTNFGFVQKIAAGDGFAIWLNFDDELWSCGKDDNGRRGAESKYFSGFDLVVSVQRLFSLKRTRSIIDIKCTDTNTYVVYEFPQKKEKHEVFACGDNSKYQLTGKGRNGGDEFTSIFKGELEQVSEVDASNLVENLILLDDNELNKDRTERIEFLCQDVLDTLLLKEVRFNNVTILVPWYYASHVPTVINANLKITPELEILLKCYLNCPYVDDIFFKLPSVFHLCSQLGLSKITSNILASLKRRFQDFSSDSTKVKNIFNLLMTCIDQLENIDELQRQCKSKNDLTFNSRLSYLLFKILSSSLSTLENREIVVGVWPTKEYQKFQSLGLNVGCKCFGSKSPPLEEWKEFKNLSEKRISTLFFERLEVIWNNLPKNANFVIVSNDKKEVKCHKEIIVSESDFFFQVLRFGGIETREKGYLHLENLDSDSLNILLKFIYTKKVSFESDIDGVISALNLLMQIVPYKEKLLQATLIEEILSFSEEAILKKQFIKDILPSIGYLFHEKVLSFPEDFKEVFVLFWEKTYGGNVIVKDGIEKSFQNIMKNDEEK